MEDINTGETKGLIRKLDDLGRIVIPKEFRNSLKIEENQKLEMFLTKTGIFIKKV